MHTVHHGGEGWVAGARDSLLVTIKKQKELMASLSPFSVNLGISMLCSKFRVCFSISMHLIKNRFSGTYPKKCFHDDSKASQADIRWPSSPILTPLYLPPQWQEHWQHGAEEGKDLHQI